MNRVEEGIDPVTDGRVVDGLWKRGGVPVPVREPQNLGVGGRDCRCPRGLTRVLSGPFAAGVPETSVTGTRASHRQGVRRPVGSIGRTPGNTLGRRDGRDHEWSLTRETHKPR